MVNITCSKQMSFASSLNIVLQTCIYTPYLRISQPAHLKKPKRRTSQLAAFTKAGTIIIKHLT